MAGMKRNCGPLLKRLVPDYEPSAGRHGRCATNTVLATAAAGGGSRTDLFDVVDDQGLSSPGRDDLGQCGPRRQPVPAVLGVEVGHKHLRARQRLRHGVRNIQNRR